MYKWVLSSLAVIFFVPIGTAQDKEAPPGLPPRLWRASASRQDGKIVILLGMPMKRAKGVVVKRPDGTSMLPAETETYWGEFSKVDLGRTVKAFCVNGKPLEPDAVLKALAEPKGVAIFLRARPDEPTRPHPFYLALFREGTVILVINEKDIYPQGP